MKRTIITIGCSLLLVGSVAFAQTTTAKELKAIATCSNITSKVSERIAKSNTFRNKHVDNFIAAKEKVNDLVTKLKAKGYDTSNVEADLVAYQTLLSKLSTDYSTYISDLTATQNYACGKSEGEFRTQLDTARADLKTVHADDVAVHDYWKNTLKPDLQALRNSIKSTSTTSGATTTSTTTGGTN